MKTAIAKHRSTGNIHNVEVYTTLVYFIDRMETITRKEFDEFFVIVS